MSFLSLFFPNKIKVGDWVQIMSKDEIRRKFSPKRMHHEDWGFAMDFYCPHEHELTQFQHYEAAAVDPEDGKMYGFQFEGCAFKVLGVNKEGAHHLIDVSVDDDEEIIDMHFSDYYLKKIKCPLNYEDKWYKPKNHRLNGRMTDRKGSFVVDYTNGDRVFNRGIDREELLKQVRYHTIEARESRRVSQVIISFE